MDSEPNLIIVDSGQSVHVSVCYTTNDQNQMDVINYVTDTNSCLNTYIYKKLNFYNIRVEYQNKNYMSYLTTEQATLRKNSRSFVYDRITRRVIVRNC